MDDRFPNNPAEYANRLLVEQSRYRDDEHVHSLPGIFHYWSNRHIRPKLEAFGFKSPDEMFRKYLGEQFQLEDTSPRRFASLGAGNCDLEIGLASDLQKHAHTDFTIDCVDLNPAMLDRGRALAAEQAVDRHVNFFQADLNAWDPQREYDAIIVNQALHHVLKLEHLLAEMKGSLKRGGSIIISDIVGRNGHQRWPEALDIVHEFWRKLPPSYRFNSKLERYEEMYQNYDCSGDGFEAIRSEDILPLLVENFEFRMFVAFGNVIEPFVDRAFGFNFDPAAAWDQSFIDAVHERDELEFGSGNIKPTHILAVLGKEPCPMSFHAPLTPRFCVRTPDASHREPKLFASSYEWSDWPHRPEDELQKVCQRLQETEARRGKEVNELRNDLEERTIWGRGLEADLAERTKWAVLLEQELAARTGLARDLQKQLDQLEDEIEKRTAWGLALDQELQQANQQLEQRTTWALQLKQELNQLGKEFEQRTAWALELDRGLSERDLEIRKLAAELEALAWTRRLRHLAQKLRKRSTPPNPQPPIPAP